MALTKHKVKVQETKSAKWMRLKGVDNTSVSAMLPPEALPPGAGPGSVLVMTLTLAK